jgi:ATP-dependent Clp protease ATP-binding subunit ClpA
MFERFTREARAVVLGARDEKKLLGDRVIGTEHLLLAMLRGSGAGAVLAAAGLTYDAARAALVRVRAAAPGTLREGDAAALRAIGIDLDEVRARLEENFGPVSLDPPPPPRRRWLGRGGGGGSFSRRARKVLELALREALALGHRTIGSEHLLLGLLRDGQGLGARLLSQAGLDFADLRQRAVAALRAAA